MDRTRACGLVLPSGALLASAHEPLRSLLGARRVAGLQAEALRARVTLGTLDLPSARAFAEAGVTDPVLAEFLCEQAELAPPRRAAELYASALRAGADGPRLALRRAGRRPDSAATWTPRSGWQTAGSSTPRTYRLPNWRPRCGLRRASPRTRAW